MLRSWIPRQIPGVGLTASLVKGIVAGAPGPTVPSATSAPGLPLVPPT